MVDAYRFAKYLDETKLTAEEFWLLYRIMIQEGIIKGEKLKIPNVDSNKASHDFSIWSNKYQIEHKNYLNREISWREILDKLEAEEYVENWDKENYLIHKMRVTDKFKNKFLISDIDQAFMEFVEIYPKRVIDFKREKGRYPAMNLSPDTLAKMYNEKILKGGNRLLHERCLLITSIYLEDGNFRDAPMNMSNYFEAFDGIAALIEEKEVKTNNPFIDDL